MPKGDSTKYVNRQPTEESLEATKKFNEDRAKERKKRLKAALKFFGIGSDEKK